MQDQEGWGGYRETLEKTTVPCKEQQNIANKLSLIEREAKA